MTLNICKDEVALRKNQHTQQTNIIVINDEVVGDYYQLKENVLFMKILHSI